IAAVGDRAQLAGPLGVAPVDLVRALPVAARVVVPTDPPQRVGDVAEQLVVVPRLGLLHEPRYDAPRIELEQPVVVAFAGGELPGLEEGVRGLFAAARGEE